MHTSLFLICCCVLSVSAVLESRSLLVVQQHLQGKVQVEEELDAQAFRVAPEAVLCRLRGLAAGQPLVRPIRGEDSTSQASKRCAVVSNSGVLLQHSYGAEIDASDRIFRFNDAEIGGNFSSNIGSREDIRVLNWGKGLDMLNGSMSQADGATYLFLRHQVEEDVSQVRSWARQTSGSVWVGTQEVGELAKAMLSFEEFTMFGGTGGGANPTTGTMGILIALSMCEEVRAYGFALTAGSYVVPNHYYGEPYGTAAHGHCCAHASYFEEKDIWAHLSISPDTETTDVSVMPGFQRLATCTVDGRSPGSYLSTADAEVRPKAGATLYVPFRTPPKLSVESAKAATIESLAEKFCNFSSLDAQDLYVPSSSVSAERKVNYLLNRSKRCAVVSNSGAMLLHSFGAEIDASDLVFRFNDAEIGGELTAYVGSRDDVRIMNRLTGAKLLAQDIPMVQDVVYVLSRHAPEEDAKAPLNSTQREQLLFYASGDPLSVGEEAALHMLFREFTEERVGTDNPTTGMLGVMLAMTMCDEVRAYGFPLTTGNQKAPFHYYGWQKNGRADRNFEHEGAGFEKELWRRLATNADVDATDVSVVPGFKRLNCSS